MEYDMKNGKIVDVEGIKIPQEIHESLRSRVSKENNGWYAPQIHGYRIVELYSELVKNSNSLT